MTILILCARKPTPQSLSLTGMSAPVNINVESNLNGILHLHNYVKPIMHYSVPVWATHKTHRRWKGLWAAAPPHFKGSP